MAGPLPHDINNLHARITGDALPDEVLLLAEILRGIPEYVPDRAALARAVGGDIHPPFLRMSVVSVQLVIVALRARRPSFSRFGAGGPSSRILDLLRARKLAFMEIAPNTKCSVCGSAKLSVPGYDSVVFYPIDGAGVPGRSYVKTCEACHAKHHLSYCDDADGVRRPYVDAADGSNRWLQISHETAVEEKLVVHTENAL